MLQKTINFKKAKCRPFSQAITIGDFIFVSGQLPINPDTFQLVSDDFKEQTRQCFRNMDHFLEKCDLKLSYILKTTVYITDMSYVHELDEVFAEYLSEPYPTRTIVCVSA